MANTTKETASQSKQSKKATVKKSIPVYRPLTEAEQAAKRKGWQIGSINTEKFTFRIRFVEQVLGSLPSDPDITEQFIAKNAPTPEHTAGEVASIDNYRKQEAMESDKAAEDLKKGLTIFARTDEGDPFIYNYVIKGFFKNAAKALKNVTGTESSSYGGNYKSVIDNEIFVYPRNLMLRGFNKDKITHFQRPIRIEDSAGARVALNNSECIPAGTYFTCDIETLTPEMTRLVFELLDYGCFNGLSQWHNGGNGAFIWELLDKDGNVVSGNRDAYEEKKATELEEANYYDSIG